MSATTSVNDERVAVILALREQVRAAWQPNLPAAVADRLRALEADVDELLEEASIQAQRAERDAAALAHARQQARRFYVHAGGHFGPCPDPRSFMMSEAELRPIASGGGGFYHLDPSEERPDWFPRPMIAATSVGG